MHSEPALAFDLHAMSRDVPEVGRRAELLMRQAERELLEYVERRRWWWWCGRVLPLLLLLLVLLRLLRPLRLYCYYFSTSTTTTH